MPSANLEQVESILKKFLTQQQSLNDTIDQLAAPIEAAYVIADPLDDGPNSAASLLWLLWKAVINVAQSLPYDDQDGSQSRLVALFAGLKKRPTPQLAADKLERAKDKEPWSLAPIWQNLAIWGWQLREDFDVLNLLSPGGTASADGWVNLHALLARLTAAGISDQSFFGVIVLQTSLEERNDVWYEQSNEARGATIGAAAAWLLYAGEAWYTHGWQNERLSKKPRPESLWQGNPWTVDQARLRFWAKRLPQVVDETEGLADQWKSLADMATKKIDSL